MRIAIGADHAGFELKEHLRAFLEQRHDVVDTGTNSLVAVDYPDIASKVVSLIHSGRVTRSVLVCGSGVGVCVAANKFPGIRAGICHDTYSARQGVEHDDMNVLVLGARVIGIELAKEIVTAFLAADFSKEERHIKRLKKISEIEKKMFREEIQ